MGVLAPLDPDDSPARVDVDVAPLEGPRVVLVDVGHASSRVPGPVDGGHDGGE